MKETFLGLACVVALAACVGPRPDYDPGVTSNDFVVGIDNPFLPFSRGASWTYEGGAERIEVRVLDETRMIMGVKATVVRDTVAVDGKVTEDTYDWYGQDRNGSVWYLGEDTSEYENGVLVSKEGSWEWGVDGALPGIIMPGHPIPDGKPYFQEFYWGHAVDEAAVIDRGREVTVPAGAFHDTITTREWTRLERGSEETVDYAAGVGMLLKEVTKGSSKGQREELVSYSIP